MGGTTRRREPQAAGHGGQLVACGDSGGVQEPSAARGQGGWGCGRREPPESRHREGWRRRGKKDSGVEARRTEMWATVAAMGLDSWAGGGFSSSTRNDT
jgi:hypothetical protein